MDVKFHKGFTLVELVIGMVVLSIAMGIVITLVVPSASRSVDPMFQVRAAELAQSLMNEISAKSFDEKSDRLNGQIRCNEDLPDEFDDQEVACTDHGSLGAEEGSRKDYDDVDDYHGLDDTGSNILNSVAESLEVGGSVLYHDFRAQVEVFYDANFDGVNDNGVGSSKHIRITITTPTNQSYVFSSYRSNF